MSYIVTKPVVIGLCGRATTGKTTIANMLQTYFALWFQSPCFRVEFGDPIKEKIAELTGGTVSKINESKTDPLMRHVLEHASGLLGESFCTDNIRKRILDLTHTTPSIILVGGIRRIVESKLIQEEFGGMVVRVRRPGVQINSNNVSEGEIESIRCDMVISNDAPSLFLLERQINDFFWTIMYYKPLINSVQEYKLQNKQTQCTYQQ